MVKTLDNDMNLRPNWPTLFVTTMWWLWKWRNNHCFVDANFEFPRTWTIVTKKSNEIMKAPTTPNVFGTPNVRLQTVEILVKWYPPSEGQIKLNVDVLQSTT